MCILWPPRLVLAMLVPMLAAMDVFDYNWKDLGHTYGKSPQCVDIPEDLRLCYTVGYQRMMLPNLLDHETMAEVKQQAGSWVPLVHKRCHPGTQVFLCSLFAPVCLDRHIYPCRWLCESVRDSCSPIMEAFGFPWPEMLNCSKFTQEPLCISANSTDSSLSTDNSPACPACEELSTEVILDHMCASEFAVKSKIKEVRTDNMDKKVTLQKKKQVKSGHIKKEELKKLVLYLKNGEICPCQQLENLKQSYLLMGRKVGERYLLTGIHKWDKSNKEFRKALKKLKDHKCPHYDPVFK